MTRYTSATDADRQAMLDAIGVGSVDELFAEIPEAVRLRRPLDLPAGMAEQDVFDHLSAARRAQHATPTPRSRFLGAGMYDHYTPALIDSILQRSEFLTPYTPYQPEISQGGLQVMFEYQTAISELTGLPVSNASVYEGPSAVAAAGYLAKLETRRTKLVISRGVHPHSRETLVTHATGYGMTVVEAPLDGAGATDLDALAALVDDDTAAVFVAAAELPRHRRGAGAARRGRQADRRAVRRRRRPAAARHPRAARRARRRHLRRRGPDARQPARLRRPVVRVLRRRRAVHPQDAGPDRRRDARRRRQARLRAHAADARAAHPPREGDAQHLHRAGAERARRRDLPVAGSASRASSSSAS